MSLKTYIDNQVQDFRKRGSQSLMFGIQFAPNDKILGIYDAYPSVSIAQPTIIELVKIQPNGNYDSGNSIYNYNEIERFSLPLTIIQYDAATGQYLLDPSVAVGFNIDECIYFIEFSNGVNVFRTEAFKVSAGFNFPQGINYDKISINMKVY